MTQAGTIVWRVSSRDNLSRPAVFDALILPAGAPDRLGLDRATRLVNIDVPYERELPDVPLTLVVQTHADAGPLVVECDVLGADGNRKCYGRALNPLAVIVRSVDGILVTGLPG